MSIFKQLLERITGQRIQRPVMWAASKRPLHGDEFSFFGRWLKKIIYGDVEIYSGGKKLTVVMHSDVDPRTGKVYPNFEERRQKLRETEENREPRAFGVVSHDTRPDE